MNTTLDLWVHSAPQFDWASACSLPGKTPRARRNHELEDIHIVLDSKVGLGAVGQAHDVPTIFPKDHDISALAHLVHRHQWPTDVYHLPLGGYCGPSRVTAGITFSPSLTSGFPFLAAVP